MTINSDSNYYDGGGRVSPVVRRRFGPGVRECDLDPIYAAERARRLRRRHVGTKFVGSFFFFIVGATLFLIISSLAQHLLRSSLPGILSGALPKVMLPISSSPSAATHNLIIADNGAGADAVADASNISRLTSLWHDLRYFVTWTDGDYGDWFAEVDEATRSIDANWPSIPEHQEKGEDRGGGGGGGGKGRVGNQRYHKHVRSLVESRAQHLRLARAEWDRFQEAREHFVYKLARARTENWSVQFDQHIVNFLFSLCPPFPAPTISTQWSASTVSRTPQPHIFKTPERERLEQQLAQERALAHTVAAHDITEELVRAHIHLFENWDPHQVHMRAAQDAENKLLLVGTNPLSLSLTKRRPVAALKKRMEGLQQRNKQIQDLLKWLQDKFQQEGEKEIEPVRDEVIACARKVLCMWAGMLVDAQEEVLLIVRKNYPRAQTNAASPPNSSWEAWKNRNCGGTWCYDAPSIIGRLRRLMIPYKGNPVADVAQDEVSWIDHLGGNETHWVWGDVYVKACCEEGPFAHQLAQAA